MASSEKVYLPVKEITPFLAQWGLETTWKKLVLTHAQNAYPVEVASQLIMSPEFAHTTVLPKDYLYGLSLGQISIMYEYSLAYVNPSSRKSSGQYFTPDDVALWMAKQSESFPEGVWLDPCSGVGNLGFALASIQEDPETFILEKLILTDKDPVALLIARALFTLKFYKQNTNLFSLLKDRMIQQDFLENTDGLPSKIKTFTPDYVIANPPYAAHNDDRWETKKARDLYVFFLEVIVKNMKGYITVTPQSYTHGSKFKELRKLIINNFNVIDIYNFDNIPDSIFKGIKFGSTNTNTANSVRASIMVAQKTDGKTFTRITPLLRWLSAERNTMWQEVDKQLVPVVLTENIFPKHYKGLSELYNEVLTDRWEPLSNLLSPTQTPYVLIVPTTPRYYITATKRKLSRTSFKELFFRSEEDMNRAYVYLNSSLLYWWWRLNDGGMTLSTETLLSLPVEKTLTVHKDLVKKLEKSETSNLVVKMNAGKGQENVKHSMLLIEEINERLFHKKTTRKLLATHKNTNL